MWAWWPCPAFCITVPSVNGLKYCKYFLKQVLKDGYYIYFGIQNEMRCFKKVAFPKRLALKRHEMVIKTNMLSCVNTIFFNNLSFTEHIIPF